MTTGNNIQLPEDTPTPNNFNYIVMVPLTLISCAVCSAINLSFVEDFEATFFYTAIVMPVVALIGSAIGWSFGALISKSSYNPLDSIRLFLSYIAIIFGAGFGFWLWAYVLRTSGQTVVTSGIITDLLICILPWPIFAAAIGYAIGHFAKRTRETPIT
ncbi:MAG: hypothetical protein QNJ45_17070 [Ardenticatenaceae bacterium]|nr:hypothetical protein [Ardenticatenaceae bacterium]